MKKIKNINWKRVIASLTIFSLACGGIYFAMNKIQAVVRRQQCRIMNW